METEAMDNPEDLDSRLLWQHKDPLSTRMYDFKVLIEESHQVQLSDYEALHRWSIENLNAFWKQVWHFTAIVASEPFCEVNQSNRDSISH